MKATKRNYNDRIIADGIYDAIFNFVDAYNIPLYDIADNDVMVKVLDKDFHILSQNWLSKGIYNTNGKPLDNYKIKSRYLEYLDNRYWHNAFIYKLFWGNCPRKKFTKIRFIIIGDFAYDIFRDTWYSLSKEDELYFENERRRYNKNRYDDWPINLKCRSTLYLLNKYKTKSNPPRYSRHSPNYLIPNYSAIEDELRRRGAIQ